MQSLGPVSPSSYSLQPKAAMPPPLLSESPCEWPGCCVCQVADDSEDAQEDAILGALMRRRASQAYRFIVCELPVRLPSTRLGPEAGVKEVGIGAWHAMEGWHQAPLWL